MASRGGAGSRAAGLGGGDSPSRPPIFRKAERRKWNRSEGARSGALAGDQPGAHALKLTRYAATRPRAPPPASNRAPRLPVAASFEEDDLVPARSPTFSVGDYVHGSDEEEAVMAHTFTISEAEARARFRREEADAVRQIDKGSCHSDWYDPCLNVMIVDNNDEDPATYEEAMMSPDSNKWQEAMKSEMGSMYDNKVWTLVDLPDSRKAVENKWIFKRKTDADAIITAIELDIISIIIITIISIIITAVSTAAHRHRCNN
ncbi:hypothetical protein QYE76_056894 [Lolium multiflorum]|uniref:Retrotransposon protein, putative, Ty1-copia subclass n=1 Tax=Lolium multiflorum TaxID=4521 RepID=A0AAD8T3D8_LOLMU|nr:hypothetical protein QYE76_056894 [Lolium multiflorum]